MAEEKTYVFGEGAGNGILGLLGPMLSQREVDSIKCKLPESVSVPYSPVVGVPTCVAAQFGLNALGYSSGLWNNGSIWA